MDRVSTAGMFAHGTVGTSARGDGSVVIVDNYDSFTYNTVQLLGQLGVEARVVTNDQLTVAELASLRPRGILLSAGPGVPESAGITLDVIGEFAGRVPLLGVCLGHQAIARAFGGQLKRAERLLHGKTSPIIHDGTGLFEGLPNPVAMGRYNSLLVDEATLPQVLRVTARSDHGEIMGLCHAHLPIEGVQFHPESVLSTCGGALLRNWLERLAAAEQPTLLPGRSPLASTAPSLGLEHDERQR